MVQDEILFLAAIVVVRGEFLGKCSRRNAILRGRWVPCKLCAFDGLASLVELVNSKVGIPIPLWVVLETKTGVNVMGIARGQRGQVLPAGHISPPPPKK